MKTFGYTLDNSGNVLKCGYENNYENYVNGSEPFKDYEILFFKKNGSEWVKIERILTDNKNWHEPDWNFRITITKEQLGELTLNYFNLVLSLNTEPVNPRYEENENIIVYLNNITDEGKQVLKILDIQIEEKP